MAGTMDLFHRHPDNPILTVRALPYAAGAVFNPGVAAVDGEALLLMRVEDLGGRSHLTCARSRDGIRDWQVDATPALSPGLKALPEEPWGVEDARISRIEEREEWVIAYTAYSECGPLVSLATTRDFRSFQRLGPAVPPEIDALSSEPAWSNSWTGEANIPDYSGVRERSEALLSEGHADAVVSLGKKLMEAGKEQVEMSHDEGETATEIAECMEVVFRALPQSSMSPSEKILWAIDIELSDDYGLCGNTEIFWNKEQGKEAWTVVADELARRLSETKPEKGRGDFAYGYDRDRLSNRLIHALHHAGRSDEVIPLCEREAEVTGSYVRLVDALMEAKRWEEATQWARKGIEATSAALPGIASELRDRLRKLSEQEGDVLGVAAFRAEEFFEHPGLAGFQELEKAAQRAKVGPSVRAFAMHYLKTGKRPAKSGSKGKGMPQWPLPETGVAATERARQPEIPMTSVLIDIAIAEKNPEEALRWHDQAREKGWGWRESSGDRVAEAVAEVYPERALEIWKKLAEARIAQVKPSAYEVAAGYLRKVHKALKRLGREEEWKACLAGIRETHRRKRRLLEILDGLNGRRILDS
ncbi:MAG: hypothetical protein J7M27_03985 [Candidatus Latescibacteria bacterium]|nr:hypothetical protein [Candidatus Latescibacterota bacterium]